MATNYKLLILDYGGVYSFPYVAANFDTIMVKSFGRVPNITEREQISVVSRQLGSNKINTLEYITYVGEILRDSTLPTLEQFENETMAVTSPPTPEMIELVNKLRGLGINVSLLSDMYMFEIKRTKPWGRYKGFDFTSFSAEAGLTKHNPEFFEKTLTHFGIAANESLFVDDTLSNVAVAQSAGLGTLLADKERFVRVDQLVQEIYSLLGIMA